MMYYAVVKKSIKKYLKFIIVLKVFFCYKKNIAFLC